MKSGKVRENCLEKSGKVREFYLSWWVGTLKVVVLTLRIPDTFGAKINEKRIAAMVGNFKMFLCVTMCYLL